MPSSAQSWGVVSAHDFRAINNTTATITAVQTWTRGDGRNLAKAESDFMGPAHRREFQQTEFAGARKARSRFRRPAGVFERPAFGERWAIRRHTAPEWIVVRGPVVVDGRGQPVLWQFHLHREKTKRPRVISGVARVHAIRQSRKCSWP